MNLVLLHFNNSQCVFYGSKQKKRKTKSDYTIPANQQITDTHSLWKKEHFAANEAAMQAVKATSIGLFQAALSSLLWSLYFCFQNPPTGNSNNNIANNLHT